MNSSPTASTVTLGLLADRFDEPYQQAILKTMEGAAQQRGANLLAFAGGIPGSTLRGSDKRSLMFELVDSQTVDGVILLAGTMVNQLGVEGLTRLLARIEGLPVCAIGVEVPEMPSIVVDNDAGVRQAMTHLITHHGAERIGFVRGPQRNKEAEARYAAYRAEMDRAKLTIDPRFVFDGDFLRGSGTRAVQAWLAAPSKELPDSVLCANDEMALGAVAALGRAGIRVPEDVRVVGFDGVEVARLSSPPLSTVRQPLEDLAVMAVRTVMDQIAGRKVAPLQTLGTHLVVRDSCGCVLQLTSTGQSQMVDEGMPSQRGTGEDFNTAFQRFRSPLQAELARVARGEFSSFAGWDSELTAAFSDQVAVRDGSFLQALTQLLGRVRGKGQDVGRLQDVISAFRRFALPCTGDDQQLRMHVENVLQEARIIIAAGAERAHGERSIELERFAVKLSEVGSSLVRTFDLVKLAKAVCRELPRLGIDAFYLCAYEGAASDTGLPAKARLLAGFDLEHGVHIDKPSEATFDTAGLLPPALQPRATPGTRQLSVLPLFIEDDSLGYCLVQARGGKAAVLEVLRDQLSAALYGAQLASRSKHA
jgi:phosphoserine phosphatase RsbU/P